ADAAVLALQHGSRAQQVMQFYGKEAVEALKKYGKPALQMIDAYGFGALELIELYKDSVVDAFKVGGEDAIQLAKDYGRPALNAINTYGARVIPIIKKGSPYALHALEHGANAAFGALVLLERVDADPEFKGVLKEGAKVILKHGIDAANVIRSGGGAWAVKAIAKHEEKALDELKKSNLYKRELSKLIYEHGPLALNALKRVGSDRVMNAVYKSQAVGVSTKSVLRALSKKATPEPYRGPGVPIEELKAMFKKKRKR
ncbi:MAG: hypothetical protein ACPL4N_02545, partial [Candidatus Norongarragalinales archaeon]